MSNPPHTPVGARLLDLTTVNSGQSITLPYLPDGERSLLIAVQEPAWYRDLLDHPRVTIQDGDLTYQADAVVVEGEEGERLFARAVEADASWAEAAGHATAPVVALTPIFEGPPDGSLGELLITIHKVLRRELAAVRKELAGSGPGLVAQLRVNCLTFCHGLHQHHTGESGRIFPMLGERHPELAPVLARLEQEHKVVEQLLDGIQELLRSDHPGDRLLPEFDRLAAELDAHLDYEEQQLVAALNALELPA